MQTLFGNLWWCEIYDHVWPWIDPVKGIPVEATVKKQQRKSTGAGRYKPAKKENIKLDKIKRVHKKKAIKLAKMVDHHLSVDTEKI